MKQSVFMPILAAVLIFGLVFTLVSVLNRNTDSGKGDSVVIPATTDAATDEQPAKDLKAVVSNLSDDVWVGYRENDTTDKIIFCAVCETLKPNTNYEIAFNYREADHKSFADQRGLSFKYAIDYKLPQSGDTLGWGIGFNGGVIPGSYYPFTTTDDGVVIFYLLEGERNDTNSTEAAAKAICEYIKDQFTFMIYEVEG